MTTKLPRGIRNNNPLNLEKTSDNWLGEIEGSDTRFMSFSHSKYGIRAGAKLLKNYQRLYNLDTVEKIINRFAPSFENDTNSYAYHVSKEMGINKNDQINLNDYDLLFKMVKAMIKHENGLNPYSDTEIYEGVRLA